MWPTAWQRDGEGKEGRGWKNARVSLRFSRANAGEEETAGLLLLLRLRQEIILLSFACDSLFLVSPPDSPDSPLCQSRLPLRVCEAAESEDERSALFFPSRETRRRGECAAPAAAAVLCVCVCVRLLVSFADSI